MPTKPVTDNSFETCQISDKPIVVDFWAEWWDLVNK